jgi:two-component system chemotaxis response regulator CheB
MTYDFFIVAIGSSAGGLPPLKEVFAALPVKTNAAFVLVPHLITNYKSNLDIILSKHTHMPIVWASHQLRLQQGIIYLLPEGKIMTVKDGHLMLRKRYRAEVVNNAIDVFFSSLAKEAKEKAIGVILSGGGNDGLAGVKHIAFNNGLVIVQDPKTAEFPYMPRSIIKLEHPDFILSPKDMAGKIVEYLDFSKRLSTGHFTFS